MSTTTLVSKSRTLLHRSRHHFPEAAAAACRRSFAASSDSSQNLVKTALNDLHKELGGDMVPFAGYELPVLYKGTEHGGVMKEHLWCRDDGRASLFDVSHMGQVWYLFMYSICRFRS
jgi:aminomethyltransferase